MQLMNFNRFVTSNYYFYHNLNYGTLKMETKENQIKIIENYVKSYNRFDVNGMCENLGDNIIFENISNGNTDMRIDGIENFKEQAKISKEYFTNRNQTIKKWNFNNEIVTIEIDYEATVAMDLPNGLKKGDALKLKGVTEFIFKNNKIFSLKDKN